MLAGAEGSAPAGTAKGLSDRPLETFGPMLAQAIASQEAQRFFFIVSAWESMLSSSSLSTPWDSGGALFPMLFPEAHPKR